VIGAVPDPELHAAKIAARPNTPRIVLCIADGPP
jgi:hypothetical protein